MKRDPKVDQYIEQSQSFAQPILRHLRALIHQTLADVEEATKWSHPHFMVKGKNVAGMAAFKQHASLNIHGDSGFEGLAKDGSMGQFGRITSLADLPADQAISDRLKAGEKRVLETGSALVKKSASVRKAKPELPIPDDFANALKSNPAAMATLEAFAPSHRREYVEWVIEAKRAETRARRVAQAIKMLADGKKRNWKYENC